MLEIKGLQLQRGSFQLGPLDWQLPSPGAYSIIGSNGCGKTSLLRALMGRLRFSASFLSSEFQNSKIGSVGLEDLLVESWTLEEMFHWVEGLSGRSVSRPQFVERMKPMWKLKANQLSSGKKRQLELCLILSRDFDLYFLDEPFAHLDPSQESFYKSEIIKMIQEKKSYFLFAGHSESEIFYETDGSLSL